MRQVETAHRAETAHNTTSSMFRCNLDAITINVITCLDRIFVSFLRKVVKNYIKIYNYRPKYICSQLKKPLETFQNGRYAYYVEVINASKLHQMTIRSAKCDTLPKIKAKLLSSKILVNQKVPSSSLISSACGLSFAKSCWGRSCFSTSLVDFLFLNPTASFTGVVSMFTLPIHNTGRTKALQKRSNLRKKTFENNLLSLLQLSLYQ